MSIGKGVTTYEVSGPDTDLNSGADVLTIAPMKPIEVLRFGFIVDNGTDSGTDLVLSLDKRPTAGTDTDREELATLQPSATVTQGDGRYFDLTSRLEVNPGEELIVEVKTVAGVASTGRVFAEYVEYPFQHTSADSTEDRLGNMTEET